MNRATAIPANPKRRIGYAVNAEKTNGRWAMIGFVALIGAYVTTGQIIPGVF